MTEAKDEGSEGRAPVKIRHYAIRSLEQQEPELIEIYDTVYVHALAYILSSGFGLIFKTDDGLDAYSVPSATHLLAIIATDLARQQEQEKAPKSEEQSPV